jgi:hypothetical protein
LNQWDIWYVTYWLCGSANQCNKSTKWALLGLFPRPQKMLLSIALRAEKKQTTEYICIKYPPNSTLYSYRKGFQALS